MNPQMDCSLAEGYKSPSQIARVITEHWFLANMYCPACPSQRLAKTRDNTKVVDFVCSSCGAEYQLKSKSGAIGKKLRDAAYEPMKERIKGNSSPNFAFLVYDRSSWSARTLLFVPAHFITLQAIEACRPLGDGARRKGWVGCNILMSALSMDARLYAIQEGHIVDPAMIRDQWQRFSWLATQDAAERGWVSDVLKCIECIGQRQFTIRQVYAFDEELGRLHPHNRNIRPKIRQQLQVLRDRGVLRFAGNGKYELISSPEPPSSSR
ncbi:MAG TPA: DpnI domain-containing protein [Candidatus Brocadiia bacterium]|nr:DpnI domain-containing protein [Candidatus Brocadiia bacterium]